MTSLERPQDVNFEPLLQMHFHCIIFNFISTNVCLKYYSLNCFIVLDPKFVVVRQLVTQFELTTLDIVFIRVNQIFMELQ